MKAANGAAPTERKQMKFMVTLITDGTAMEGMTPEERSEFARIEFRPLAGRSQTP